MCGRYSLTTPDPAALRARFPVGESVTIRQRFNVAPTDEVLAVTTDREGNPRGELLRWGLVPSWSKGPRAGPPMINARVETIAERPSFRTAVERFRCLIIADGFYEWRAADAERGHKQAFHITRADRAPFAFAGLWSIWHGDEAYTLRSCTILTAPANSAIAPLHDRMPVILTSAAERAWLDHRTPPAALPDLLAGLPAHETALTAVGTAVGDVRNDGPECLAPPLPVGQPALF
jgi:putative SOS response-associated peptidase YedK